MKPLVYAGVGLCGAGMVALIVGAVVDVNAAEPWASVGGGIASLAGIALALYAQFAQSAAPAASGTQVSADGERSIAAGGSIGAAMTGNGAAPASAPTPSAAPTPPPASGTVTAAGDRSIAAGGHIGSASTGDA
ncbi:hypothetical protein HUT11_04565 [Streptomyces seoulensis]|nr:hypothetical protein HUT11_04565 [Streptomyces seoulensis]